MCVECVACVEKSKPTPKSRLTYYQITVGSMYIVNAKTATTTAAMIALSYLANSFIWLPYLADLAGAADLTGLAAAGLAAVVAATPSAAS